MITLANDELFLDVVNPNEERALLGARYCAGGYIFQVQDAARGPLLSGPTYPESFDWYNGQGIPDSFASTPVFPREESTSGILVLGVGICDRALKSVLQYDDWEISQKGDELVTMTVSHRFETTEVKLTRTVQLVNRSIISATTVENTGSEQLSMSWFPHPFFPQPSSPELVRFSTPVTVPADSGYKLSENGFIHRTRMPPADGFYAALGHPGNRGLSILQRHPVLGLISAEASFTPSLLPVWGNDRTISWEPHLDRSVASGESATWTMSYHF